MSLSVAVYRIRNHHRSQVVCDAMAAGAAANGEHIVVKYEEDYREVEADVAVFYGLEGNTPRIFKEYSEKAKAVYTDLGYWGRREGGRWCGYHKAVVNDRHPTTYFQKRAHMATRAQNLGVVAAPWQKNGSFILLAGMGDKGAAAEGYDAEYWERKTIETIRKYTRRPIIYRPKPSWKRARPIQGVGYSPSTVSIDHALRNCYAVVTHHSNVAVDALVLGIPVFCWKGVAMPMASQDLSQIETPFFPSDRQQWINDVAYCQWSIEEMKRGIAWRDLKNEGLLT